MSYILDSLKKSEQQRRQGELPNLQSEHPGSLPAPRRKRVIWPWLVVLALLLNAGLLAWWLASRTVAPQAAAPAPVAMPKPAPQTAAAPVPDPSPAAPSTPEAPSPVTAAVAPQPPAASADTSAPAPTTEAAPPPEAVTIAAPVPMQPPGVTAVPVEPPVVPLDDVPAGVRSGLPELSLSLLYYTSAPERRLARLNGRNLRQGDVVQGGVVLEEIRPEGAVINFRGQRILLSRP